MSRMIRWALWTPAHAFIALGGIAAALIAASTLLSVVASSANHPTEDTASADQTMTPLMRLSHGEDPAAGTTKAERGESAFAAATGFTAAWQDTDQDRMAWAEGMRPYTTGPLLAMMYGADPAEVPTAAATVSIRKVYAHSALAEVAVSGYAPVSLSLVLDDTGWKVDSVAAADGVRE